MMFDDSFFTTHRKTYNGRYKKVVVSYLLVSHCLFRPDYIQLCAVELSGSLIAPRELLLPEGKGLL